MAERWFRASITPKQPKQHSPMTRILTGAEGEALTRRSCPEANNRLQRLQRRAKGGRTLQSLLVGPQHPHVGIVGRWAEAVCVWGARALREWARARAARAVPPDRRRPTVAALAAEDGAGSGSQQEPEESAQTLRLLLGAHRGAAAGRGGRKQRLQRMDRSVPSGSCGRHHVDPFSSRRLGCPALGESMPCGRVCALRHVAALRARHRTRRCRRRPRPSPLPRASPSKRSWLMGT